MARIFGCLLFLLTAGCQSDVTIHFSESISLEEAYEFASNKKLALFSLTAAPLTKDSQSPVFRSSCYHFEADMELVDIYSAWRDRLERKLAFYASIIDRKIIEAESIKKNLETYPSEIVQPRGNPFTPRSYADIERDLKATEDLIDMLVKQTNALSEVLTTPRLSMLQITSLKARHQGWPMLDIGENNISKIKKSNPGTDPTYNYPCL